MSKINNIRDTFQFRASRKGKSSRNGNPSYTVVLDGSGYTAIYDTKPDSLVAYEVSNFRQGQAVEVELQHTRGEWKIIAMKLAQATA